MSERYEVVKLTDDSHGRNRWAALDTKTGELVKEEGDTEPIVFYSQRSAENWIYSRISLDNAGVGRD